jgi:hypothetical protein
MSDGQYQPRERYVFMKNPDGTYTRVVMLLESINDIMEDGIYDVMALKGPGHFDHLMIPIKKSLDFVLKDDEISKSYCIKLLDDPTNILLLSEIQRFAPNQEVRNFANIYSYELERDK